MLFIRNKNGYQILESQMRIKGGGWLLVSPQIESKLLGLLPYVKLEIEGDVIIGVEDDVEARENQPEPTDPPIDDITALQLAVAELAESQAADQTANELALAELAEIVLGG